MPPVAPALQMWKMASRLLFLRADNYPYVILRSLLIGVPIFFARKLSWCLHLYALLSDKGPAHGTCRVFQGKHCYRQFVLIINM